MPRQHHEFQQTDTTGNFSERITNLAFVVISTDRLRQAGAEGSIFCGKTEFQIYQELAAFQSLH